VFLLIERTFDRTAVGFVSQNRPRAKGIRAKVR
jgi:hypothetical protein